MSGFRGGVLALLVLPMLVLGGGIVGCGGAEDAVTEASAPSSSASGGEQTALELVRLSERRTVEAGSARFTVQMDLPVGNGMPDTSMTMQGVQDFETRDGTLDMTMAMMPPESVIEGVIVDDTMYQRFPQEMRAGFMPPGKEWIATDVQKQYREQFGVSPEDLQSPASSTPADRLEYLRSVGSVEKLGSENIGGVRTDHYRAVVSLQRELDSLRGGPEVTAYYRDIEEQLGADELPVEVWLDRQGRVRKQVTVTPLPDSTPVEGADGEMTGQPLPEGDMTMTTTFTDFGVPVDVTAPPEGAVISQDELRSLMQQAG